MLETILLGITAYIGTNMDDLLLGMFLFANADEEKDGRRILLGKYLGIGFLVLVSAAAAFGLRVFPLTRLSVLGVIPILLGIKEIRSGLHDSEEEQTKEREAKKTLAVWVMMITIANGADNIGVYIPLFAGFEIWQVLVVCGIFALMTFLWCCLSQKIAEWKFLHSFLTRYKKWIIPTVFIALGIYIIFKG